MQELLLYGRVASQLLCNPTHCSSLRVLYSEHIPRLGDKRYRDDNVAIPDEGSIRCEDLMLSSRPNDAGRREVDTGQSGKEGGRGL